MNILQKIFIENYEEIIYILHPRQAIVENIDRMINCGDPSFGGALYGCTECGKLKFVPFRCKSRFCPSCGTMYSIDRTTAMSFKIINANHRHCIFTIDDELRHFFAEGLLKSLIHSSRVAIENPTDYEARSNIMWIATWALNTLVACGKSTDWMVHMLGQSVGAYTDATHGMTLAAVSIPYYKFIMPYGLAKFKRYAINVWNVSPDGKTDEEIANEGLSCMEN